MKHNKITISPRLFNGDSRVNIGHRLPDNIKEGLKAIARGERKSVGWVLEEIIIDYFGFKTPKYKVAKKNDKRT